MATSGNSERTTASRRTSVASTTSSSQPSSSTRAQRRGSRTTNACEACKKRKTKCSGPPSVCEACQKVDTFCHFNLRLDTRRKLAYKPRIVRERQQYILEGILQILKHNHSSSVEEFVQLIRSEARPQKIAHCLKFNLHQLQGRGLIPSLEVDETDLVSLGLQSLFSHRAGRNGTKTTDSMMSPTTSDRNESCGSFRDTSHTDFAKILHKNDSMATGAGEFQTSFGHINTDGSSDMEEQLLDHLDSDSPSDGSGELAYNHDFATTFSPESLHTTFKFGNSAEAVLPSNVRPLFQHTGLYQPGYWRTVSPASLQQNVIPSHGPQKTSHEVPDHRMYDMAAPANRTCISPQNSTHLPFGSGPQIGGLTNQDRTDSELLFRERMAQEHWNIPNWAYEITSTAS